MVGIVGGRRGQSHAAGSDEAGKIVHVPVGMVVLQAVAQPDDLGETQVLVQPLFDRGPVERRVAVRIEQALLGGQHHARAVAVDCSAFEHPVRLGVGKAGVGREPFADAVVSGQVVLAAPAVETEALCAATGAAAGDDRPRVAEPDVAERFDDHRGEGRKPTRHGGCGLVGGDNQDLLASTVRVHRAGERRHFLLGGRKTV